MHLDSIADLAWHIELLDPWIGDRDLNDIHDTTLQPFIEHRLQTVKPKTVKSSLEVVRAILNLAAQTWCDPTTGKTWITTARKITMPTAKTISKTSNAPYPLSYKEVTALFTLLEQFSPDQATICRFSLFTGLRSAEARELRWDYEEQYSELDRPVFFIPPESHKPDRDRIVVLSDSALAIIKAQRGKSEEWVFPSSRTGRPYIHLNTNQWQKAWKQAKLPTVGFTKGPHNLRHTLGTRLRRCKCPQYIISQFLGHADQSVTDHYSATDIQSMIDYANEAEGVTESPIFRKRRKRVVREKRVESPAPERAFKPNP